MPYSVHSLLLAYMLPAHQNFGASSAMLDNTDTKMEGSDCAGAYGRACSPIHVDGITHSYSFSALLVMKGGMYGWPSPYGRCACIGVPARISYGGRV